MSTLLRTHRVHALASVIGLGLLAARGVATGRGGYYFLIWNLFLAWLPLWFAIVAARADAADRPRMAWLAGAVWLLFFPNAPDLVTDLKHWTARPPVPAWYDLWLAVHFAWLGVSLGFSSLQLIERAIRRRRGPATGATFAFAALGLASFGIYLGRFGRWNSWDIIVRPGPLLRDIGARVFNSTDHLRTWGYTAVGALFLWSAYAMQRASAEPALAEVTPPPGNPPAEPIPPPRV